ncbi:MAG: Sensor histidine kinase RcsC [Candidatus Omnitrophica bacterium]|nr:Sensor histidine kinase RcsC [Candidatus Omnitrophota bacterium]
MRLFKRTLVIAVLYYALARLALYLAVPPGYASPIWPAAGAALAFTLAYGPRMLIGIFVGSVLANVMTSGDTAGWPLSTLIAVGIAIGSVAQTAVCAKLLRVFLRDGLRLTHPGDILRFIVLTLSACLVSPLSGTTLLCAAGRIPVDQYTLNALVWWAGDATGAVLFTPLALAWIGRPKDIWKARRWHLALPIMVTLSAMWMIHVYIVRVEEARVRSEFGNIVHEFHTRAESKISDYADELMALKSFYDSSQHVSREEFADFVQHTLHKRRSIRALEWVPLVTPDSVDELVREARESGHGAFSLKEIDEKGVLVPAQARDFHLPIYYVQPYQGNEAALGLDLAHSAQRREYLLKARDSGSMTASVLPKLAQDTESNAMLLIAVPVYMKGARIDTLEGRRAAFRGCLVSIYTVRSMMDRVLDPAGHLMNVRVYDVLSEGERRPIYTNTDTADPPNPWRHTRRLNVLDRIWDLEIEPARAFLVRYRTWAIWFMLFSGFLFTAILSSFLLVITGQTTEVLRLVDERTAELHMAKTTLENQFHAKDQLAMDLARQTELLKEQKATILNILQDTEEARRRAEYAENKILEAMKAKSEFISIVSHELRTPLTVIKEGISIVLDGPTGTLNDMQMRCLTTAHRNVDRLSRMINDVLDFQKLESGRHELHLSEQSLNDLIREALPSFVALAESKSLELVTDLSGDLPRVMLDKDKITQVLMNYVANAVKFTDTGRITIRTRFEQGCVTVSVEDTGIGLHLEDIPRIFQSFAQIGRLESHRATGTGLGLAISKKIVELHGGRVGVESTYGTGSTFSFWLPTQPPAGVQ